MSSGRAIGLVQGVGTVVTDADDVFLAIVGRTRDELERGEIDFTAITPPEWAHADEAGMQQSSDTGAFTTPYDKEYVRPDGRRVRVTLSCAWRPGSVEHWIGYVIDVGALAPQVAPHVDEPFELSQPQPPEFYWTLAIELARERAHQRAMVDNVDALIWTIDTEMRLASANQAFFEVMVDATGRPARVGASLVADIPYPEPLEGQRDRWRAWYERALAGERLSVRSITPIGRGRHYENLLSPIEHQDGRVVGVACVSFDVTARVEAEQGLRDSEARFRTLAEAAPVGVFELDRDGFPVYMNERSQEIYGRSIDELLRGTRRQHVHEDDREEYVARFSRAVERRETVEAAFRIRRPDSTTRHLRMWLTPIGDEHDRDAGFVGIVDDQTDRMALAARLAQRERLESLGTLAGGIAHDFNNVLAVVLGYAELALLEAPEEPALRSSIEQIRTASLRARDMVRQILAFSRRSDHAHGALDLAALVEESVGLMRASWPPDVQCHLRRDEGSVVVVGDASALQRVVVNLCSNARDAVRDVAAPRVWVSVEREGDEAVVKVTDNGQGIPAGAVEHIFEPFFSTKGPGDGTGMGLAVAHGVITGHGGSVTVDTAWGRGTTFTVVLPLAPQGTAPVDHAGEPAADAAAGSAGVPGASEWGDRPAPVVLVVEDEPAVADVVRVALERAGCEVVTCASGEEAFECFLERPDEFDLVLSDVVMPGMSGDRLVTMVLRERPELPVMLMTGYSSTVTPEYAERLGVRTLLHKPLGIDEVVSAVRAAVLAP